MSRSPYIRAMIGSLRDRIATWCQDFLTQALSIGSDAFKTVLADQGKIWADACARYRTGVPGYKRYPAPLQSPTIIYSALLWWFQTKGKWRSPQMTFAKPALQGNTPLRSSATSRQSMTQRFDDSHESTSRMRRGNESNY